MMISAPNRFAGSLFGFLLALSLATVAHAQLNEHCTVSVLNRTVQVKPDGSWVLPNILISAPASILLIPTGIRLLMARKLSLAPTGLLPIHYWPIPMAMRLMTGLK
jgi:hypothetical protein